MIKRLLLGLLFLSAVGQIQAQIVIQSTHMPKSNDTFRFVTGNPVSYTSQIALDGPAKFWVFGRETTPQTTLVEYKSSMSTPYAFYFLNTVGLKVADSIGLSQFKMEDVYQFYSNNSSSYRIEGIGFKISLAALPLAGNYQLEDKVYVFPLEYGNRDSTGFKVKVNIPLVGAYSQSGYRITEVVGHGKVVVVDDTLECLKVRSEIIGADTIETQFAKFGFPTRRIEYKWLTLQHHIPVVEITGAEVAGQFVPSQARYLNLAPKPFNPPTAIEVPEPVSSLVYPNPANDRIFKSDEVMELTAFDLQGKVMHVDWSANAGSINWPAGFYLLQIIKTDGSRENLRLIIRD